MKNIEVNFVFLARLFVSLLREYIEVKTKLHPLKTRYMQLPFVHLHVHSQFSVLDGQASIPALVDKAIKDGQPGMALTDHGNMFGIKEFFNYVKKKNGKTKENIKALQKRLAALEEGKEEVDDREQAIADCRAELEAEE